MAKTPSPKVIACYLIREALKNVPENTTAEELTSLVDSKVSDEKKEKVVEQWEKVTASLAKKITAVIDKFEGGTGKSKPAAKTSGSKDKPTTKGPTEDKKKGKPLTDERVKKAKKALGKGKNKKKKTDDDD